uniref:methyltransferase domain-containing protein n=1 Tax=Streptomyces sp. NRRL S-1896 TaxID=1463893 RepID=UPI0022772899
AIDAVRAMDVVEPLIVDLCSGSGAIALAMAQEVPRSRVHAVELSEDALVWTRRNAEGTRVTVHHGDALTALPELDGQVKAVAGQATDPITVEVHTRDAALAE